MQKFSTVLLSVFFILSLTGLSCAEDLRIDGSTTVFLLPRKQQKSL